MKSVGCWRCKSKVPMLDEREYEAISSGIRSGLLSVKHRLRTQIGMKKTDEADLYRESFALLGDDRRV
jgi:hypothetical protein